jgi:glycosyltransferase involved in cell wall biosynthesis
MKIAVVMPVYNGEKSIQKSIASLELQTFSEWIAIIVNDGSTDNTAQILSKLNPNKFIVLTLKVNSGRGAARQVALEKIRELNIAYMCMLDADDWYYPNKLAIQHSFMEENCDIILMSTSMIVNNSKSTGVTQPFLDFKKLRFDNYSDFIFLPHGPSIIRMKDIINADYEKSFRFAEDKDFLRKILLHKEYCFLPEITYCYNRESSFSYKKYKDSLFIDNKSYFKLKNSLSSKLKYIFINCTKVSIVWYIIQTGKIETYFSRSLREISDEEKEKFDLLTKSLKN